MNLAVNKRMEHTSLVSIIVPIFNVEAFLERCLDSILVQTYTNIEVLLINDGSSDSSEKICLEYQRKDSRFIYYTHQNQGNAYSRNRGVQLSRGEFIIFVDSDDWLAKELVENCIAHSQNVDLVCFSFYKEYLNHRVRRYFDVDGLISAVDFRRRSLGLVSKELSDPSQLESLSTMWGKLYQSSIIKNNSIEVKSLKDIGAWEDGLFNWEYLKYCQNVLIVNEPLYHYRKFTLGTVSTSYKPDFLNKSIYLFRLLENDIQEEKLDGNFQIALSNRIALSITGLGLNEAINKKHFADKVRNFKSILGSPVHREALQNLTLTYFPLHWKLFFYLAKKQNAFFSFLLILAIKKIIRRK